MQSFCPSVFDARAGTGALARGRRSAACPTGLGASCSLGICCGIKWGLFGRCGRRAGGGGCMPTAMGSMGPAWGIAIGIKPGCMAMATARIACAGGGGGGAIYLHNMHAYHASD